MIKFILLSLFIGQAFASSTYTFTRKLEKGTRGGVSQGVPVVHATENPSVWTDLQEEGISTYEKDRRAILALQGEFEVEFEFLETFLMDTPKDMDVPYFSKATELVKVIEDRGDFISLQHIIVMFMIQDGKVLGPHIVKHWRQDWQWNAKERFMYQGGKHWKSVNVNSEGQWTWSVYQVDDSPRYTGNGNWQHLASASIFRSEQLSRPLPRREFSVRGDYQLLMGHETLIVTPLTWYHEQKAFKHVGKLVDNKFNGKLRAREVGQNTYRRIEHFNFSAGYDYWERTKKYWSDVRFVWADVLKNNDVQYIKGAKLPPRHFVMFSQAEDAKVNALSQKERRKLIRNTLQSYLE